MSLQRFSVVLRKNMTVLNLLVRFLLKKYEIKKCEIVDESFSTVCFFSNTAIGDTLFNTPVFRAFKLRYPSVKIIALLNPSNAILFRDDPNIDEIITYNGRWNSFFKTLRILKKRDIDIAFLLHSNEPQATPLAVLSGARYVFNIPNLKNEFNEFHSNTPREYENKERYIVLNRLKQLQFVGINSEDSRLELFLNDDDFKCVDEVIKKDEGVKFIGFQMGANSESRKWTDSGWRELAELILENTNHKIALSGAPCERAMIDKFCEQFEKYVASRRILNLAGRFSLRSAAALISRLDVFVTPDTGPLHIAAALKTPIIGLYGVMLPSVTMPNFDTEIHTFLQADLEGFSKYKKEDKHKKHDELMSKISAKDVYEKILMRLK